MLRTGSPDRFATRTFGMSKRVATSRVAVALAMILATACSPTASQNPAPSSTQTPTASAPGAAVPSAPVTPLLDFASLVERFGKAVVNVEVTSRQRSISNPVPGPDTQIFIPVRIAN
jgi:S1-C subfamily serine protease